MLSPLIESSPFPWFRSRESGPAAPREVEDRPDPVDRDDRGPQSLAAVELRGRALREIAPRRDRQAELHAAEDRDGHPPPGTEVLPADVLFHDGLLVVAD